MSFTFSVRDPLAAFLERFADASAALARLGCDPLGDSVLPICDDLVLDRLAMQVQASRWNEDDEDWTSASLDELVQHISTAHHAYLLSELPRLLRLTQRLGGELDLRLRALAEQIFAHLDHEETELFPACRALIHAAQGAALPDGKRLNLVAYEVETGHEDLAQKLPPLLALAAAGDDDPQLPGLRDVLRIGLAALSADLRQHRYKEEDCLIPAILHWQDILSSQQALRKNAGLTP